MGPALTPARFIGSSCKLSQLTKPPLRLSTRCYRPVRGWISPICLFFVGRKTPIRPKKSHETSARARFCFLRRTRGSSGSSTGCVLTSTTYFHYVRFFCVLTIFTTVLTVLGAWTIAWSVHAFTGIFFSHCSSLLRPGAGCLFDGKGNVNMLGAADMVVKQVPWYGSVLSSEYRLRRRTLTQRNSA